MEKSQIVKSRNREILLNIALVLNKELYDEKEISFQMFKFTEEFLLKELK